MYEPRCIGCPPGTVANWMAEMAAHVKSLDGNHLVATGAEGFFSDAPNPGNPGDWAAGEGQDLLADNASPDIDYVSVHSWCVIFIHYYPLLVHYRIIQYSVFIIHYSLFIIHY